MWAGVEELADSQSSEGCSNYWSVGSSPISGTSAPTSTQIYKQTKWAHSFKDIQLFE